MIRPLAYAFYSPREITPEGWLKTQLQIQADGLSGNLDRVWPDVRDSAWVGGDREGWERVPYWLDGFIPLVYLLRDEDRIARAERYMNAIMDAQCADGWICPCPPEARAGYDTWAALLMGKVLMVYATAAGEDTPAGQRAIDSLYRMLRHLNGHLNGTTLHGWGSARWFEGLIPALWLYERTGEDWILDLCHKLEIHGFDWTKVLASPIWATHTTGWDLITHVVNVAMMLKSDALMSRVKGTDPNTFAQAAMRRLLNEHGMACHHFTGDECLAGQSPIHGSELCSVVEAMYSYEQIFSVTGDPYWLERLEETAYNALPAAISPDMWSHQYDQLTNQIAAVPLGDPILRANGPEAVMFGLEPNFGCCTANFNQGFPKFALTTFMRSPCGILCASLAPATLTTEVDGARVVCTLDTAYPFRDRMVCCVKTDRPVQFALEVRIPGNAASATVDGVSVTPGKIHILDRVWEGSTDVTVELTFTVRVESRPDNMMTVWRGPLLFALPIGECWDRREYEAGGVARTYPYCDYHVTPTTPWNYGFAGDAEAATVHAADVDPDRDPMFTPEHPPLWLEVPMAPIAWQSSGGHCARLPDSAAPIGPVERKRLIPYGATNLRITETLRCE